MFLAPLVERLDRSQVHVTCYADGGRRDVGSQRLAAASDRWREVGGWSDDALGRTIRDDAIDILFDLAGHTDNNRLPAFARRLAPVQITWIGYVGTTGLDTVDYLLADAYHAPESAESFYCERILRMPDGYVCYEPPEYAPQPGPPPLLARGHATFGSLNNPTKFSAAAVRCWSEILRQLPDSGLILKYKGCDEPATARRLRAMFAEYGIGEPQLDLRSDTTHVEHLRVYQEIDVALDPFPYSGGITTCEATWMGVPVVTCPGETFASRHSLSHLTNANVPETIARDCDHYVELAVGLASDPERLCQLRASLRPRMAASPLCDIGAFAKAFEERLRAVWRDWCERGSS
jgi:predicted O-linked N-acetylglucosamine transferase (SPINDLY family)